VPRPHRVCLITYGELEQLLRQWGFRLERPSPVSIFRHPAQDALAALPPYDTREHVAAFHLAGIRKLLTQRGIVEQDVFDRETRAVRTS
jgi:hypothetical protein